MGDLVKVVVRPLGVEIELPPGSSLADALVPHGVEFPCGGNGRCRGCRIRVLAGELGLTDFDRERFTPAELADGWRLACQAAPNGDLVIELRQWSGLILSDESSFEFEPADGFGIAVDVGTTTLVAQLLDLSTARVLGTQSALNPQAKAGSDVMSRIRVAIQPGGGERLTGLVRGQIREMVTDLAKLVPEGASISRATLVGNTVMHHLFLARDTAPLAGYPFEAAEPGVGILTGADLDWPGPARACEVRFLPCLGGFVGSDILGVILATRINESQELTGIADLGTNGEMVMGNRERLLVASTAAGPAFEGARIAQGMRAAPGAIDRVTIEGGKLQAHVIGGGAPQGLCGSGVVDAVACGLDIEVIQPSGRMAGGDMVLKGSVKLVQQDVRELQLAKGAIAAGIRILLDDFGVEASTLQRFHLAGAFGNNLSVENTRRIGLLPFPAGAIKPVGNAALLGAKIALFLPGMGESVCESLFKKLSHVSLDRAPAFQDLFAEAMTFPEKA